MLRFIAQAWTFPLGLRLLGASFGGGGALVVLDGMQVDMT